MLYPIEILWKLFRRTEIFTSPTSHYNAMYDANRNNTAQAKILLFMMEIVAFLLLEKPVQAIHYRIKSNNINARS